jgi:hypothetical protein
MSAPTLGMLVNDWLDRARRGDVDFTGWADSLRLDEARRQDVRLLVSRARSPQPVTESDPNARLFLGALV